uniref:Uncharacterized protein n=1 Tax=Ditylenchus dipsaci TaxID=166011 RepID=A0A915EIU0_9BILA
MRERENDAFTRYVTEQNKARKLKEDLQKLQERMKDLQQSSDTSTTLEDENRRLKDELDKTVTELEQSKADAASMQTVLEEAQMQLETDKCMLRHAEEEFDKKMDQVNRQKQLDKQEIAVWKEKHDSLEARLSVPQKSVQTMTTFTLATEDHLIKCVDEPWK